MPELSPWQWWFIGAVFLMIVEIFTPALVAACLGIGCVASGLAAWLGAPFWLQILVFSVVSAFAFWGVRPFVKKILYASSPQIKTNFEALEGKDGRVLVRIDNRAGTGRVQVEGDDWKARSWDDSVVISEGETVVVTKLDSTILIVKPKGKK